MADEIKTENIVAEVKAVEQGTGTAAASTSPTFRKNTTKVRPRRQREERKEKEDDGFDHKIINIRRVTRMYKGGRRMRLSVFVAVGDRKGKVGLGLGKGADVRSAQEKAVNKAKKKMVQIKLRGNTIPHEVKAKVGAAKVFMKPAAPGTGIVAGSSMRMIADVVGIKDMLGKIFGSNNAISNAYATVEALSQLRTKRL